VSWVSSAHHVFGVKCLLGQLRHSQSSLLLGSSGGQGGESDHEEVQTREGDQVHCHLSQIGIQLTWESDACCHSGNDSADQVVQISIGRGGQLQGSEADIVQCLVVAYHDDICVLDQLMHG